MSLALGAFVAGVLISETEYRYQVEEDIKPFRDVLLGLFFVTIGMLLDLRVVLEQAPWVLLVLLALAGAEGAADFRVEPRCSERTPRRRLRTGLALARMRRIRFRAAGACADVLA